MKIVLKGSSDNLSIFVNGKWVNYGFASLDIIGKATNPKTIAKKVLCQYYSLGYTNKPEKVMVNGQEVSVSKINI